MVTIPSDAATARGALPWIAFEGRWGELQDAFFNGPTGPNLKTSWTEPIVASEGWRERAYAVPTAGIFGTDATDGFCTAVERGSRALVQLLRSPLTTLLILAALIALIAIATARTTWTPTAPLRVGRRRAWGQIVSAAGRMYVGHARALPRDRRVVDPGLAPDRAPADAGLRRLRAGRRRDLGQKVPARSCSCWPPSA